MHLLAEPLIVFGLGVDQTVKAVYDLPAPDYHDTNTAHAAALLISRLEIDRRKISHSVVT
jgi:hypothetical protein